MQNLNFVEIYSNIECEISRQKWDYWELDYLNKNWDFATVCVAIALQVAFREVIARKMDFSAESVDNLLHTAITKSW